jgi:hypothetical protein
MKTDRKKEDGPAGKPRHREGPAPEAPGQHDEESCRCKEVSQKSISQLLKVAVSDLSFWKKKK